MYLLAEGWEENITHSELGSSRYSCYLFVYPLVIFYAFFDAAFEATSSLTIPYHYG